MRGADERAGSLFSYVDLESRITPKHPLRAIRAFVNEALSTLDADLAGLYSRISGELSDGLTIHEHQPPLVAVFLASLIGIFLFPSRSILPPPQH